jgi:hypothetical protein
MFLPEHSQGNIFFAASFLKFVSQGLRGIGEFGFNI